MDGWTTLLARWVVKLVLPRTTGRDRASEKPFLHYPCILIHHRIQVDHRDTGHETTHGPHLIFKKSRPSLPSCLLGLQFFLDFDDLSKITEIGTKYRLRTSDMIAMFLIWRGGISSLASAFVYVFTSRKRKD